MKIPLGPCYIYFNGEYLAETLKEDETSLEIKTKTEEIRTDESSDIKEIIEIGKDVVFKTSLLFTQKVLNKLGVDNNFSSLIKTGEIRIVTSNKTATIIIFKTKIIIEPYFNFKNSKQNKIKLKMQALKNEFNKNIEILFGVDVYNETSARIKFQNLFLYTKDGENIPSLKIKNKNLVYLTKESETIQFKIKGKHLIKILE